MRSEIIRMYKSLGRPRCRDLWVSLLASYMASFKLLTRKRLSWRNTFVVNFGWPKKRTSRTISRISTLIQYTFLKLQTPILRMRDNALEHLSTPSQKCWMTCPKMTCPKICRSTGRRDFFFFGKNAACQAVVYGLCRSIIVIVLLAHGDKVVGKLGLLLGDIFKICVFQGWRDPSLDHQLSRVFTMRCNYDKCSSNEVIFSPTLVLKIVDILCQCISANFTLVFAWQPVWSHSLGVHLNNQDCREKAEKVLRTLGMEAAQFYVSEGVIEEAIAKATNMQRVSQKDSFCDKVKLLETLRAPFREKLQSIFPVRDQLQQGVTPKVLALMDRLIELSLNDCRCIVFVKKVASTWPLAYLLQQHVKEGVRPVSGISSMNDEKRKKHLEAGFTGLPH